MPAMVMQQQSADSPFNQYYELKPHFRHAVELGHTIEALHKTHEELRQLAVRN